MYATEFPIDGVTGLHSDGNVFFAEGARQDAIRHRAAVEAALADGSLVCPKVGDIVLAGWPARVPQVVVGIEYHDADRLAPSKYFVRVDANNWRTQSWADPLKVLVGG